MTGFSNNELHLYSGKVYYTTKTTAYSKKIQKRPIYTNVQWPRIKEQIHPIVKTKKDSPTKKKFTSQIHTTQIRKRKWEPLQSQETNSPLHNEHTTLCKSKTSIYIKNKDDAV